MVRPPTLKLALLAMGVVLGHVLALEWLARQADAISGLDLMVAPMYTRLLKPQAPAPVTPVPAAAAATPPPRAALRAAPAPRPAASSPEELARERERTRQRAAEHVRRLQEEEERRLAQQREREPLQQEEPARAGAEPPAPAAAAPPQLASTPAQAASAPEAEAASPDRWPADTRLSYSVTGMYRGPLYGSANVQWQREGGKYQVRLELNVSFITQTLTSQGEVTPEGLLPRAYEELRTGGKRRATQLGDEVVVLDRGDTVPRPPGVQDTASQFVELSQRFATGKDELAVGKTVAVWLARPGGVDQWIYDVAGRELLRTSMGEVEAFHLKPRGIPNPRGNITAEMWFAPSLQYLPVKIRVVMGSEAHLDLVVERIEQN